jgi:hypothetical protein
MPNRPLPFAFGVVNATVGASRLIIGEPKRNAVVNLLRGNVIRDVFNSAGAESF